VCVARALMENGPRGDWRSGMAERNPMAEDMFEKARRAFFGTAKTSPERSDNSAELLYPADEHRSKEVIGPSLDHHEAT
jgi:hypothetical protein